MLKKFAVTNFRGFKDKIEWDLSHPSNYEFNKEVVKDGIVNNGIIYGPNGAGKSNFSLAIFDIENHLSQKMKQADYYQNFVYAGNPEGQVKFEYLFQFGSDEVGYMYSKDAKGNLCDEQLLINNQEVFKKTSDEFRIIEEFAMSDNSKEGIMNSANNLSIVNLLLSSFPLSNQHYLIKLQNFVNSMLWFRSLKANEYIGLETGATQMEQYIIEHKLTDDFQDFIAKVSDQRFDFVTPKAGDKQLYCKIEAAQIPFSQIISTGTQSLILIYFWLTHLDKASFVFVDEFDAFYHFKLSFEVCKRLFAQDCQVFLSSHNTYLMTNDLLRPDCNFILNNNQIKSLINCTEKELRFGHNIEKLYRGGAFKS